MRKSGQSVRSDDLTPDLCTPLDSWRVRALWKVSHMAVYDIIILGSCCFIQNKKEKSRSGERQQA